MKLSVEIDPRSGFCNGVVRAIQQAENYLQFSPRLYSLGAIVHNAAELERLKKKGLEIISIAEVEQLRHDVILVRAHGEPPETYALARRNDLQVIDCTCPVVLRLQEKVRTTWERLHEAGGQVVIFGKKGHAEVNGLVGQTAGEAVVIGSVAEIDGLDFSRPVALFSQTTKDPDEFRQVADRIRARRPDAEVYDTICKQVAQRHKSLVDLRRHLNPQVAVRRNFPIFAGCNEIIIIKILHTLWQQQLISRTDSTSISKENPAPSYGSST